MTTGELAPAARRMGRAIAKRAALEELWRKFFANPSQWWDHRSEKVTPRYPDFKHKKTEEALWLDGDSNPAWVKSELAAMAPGTVQSDIFTWNRRLARYVDAADYRKAVDGYHQMQREGTLPDKSVCLRALKACGGLGALDEGRHIHKHIMQCGYDSDVYVGSSLVDMYSKCGSIAESWKVFKKMPARSVVTWNTMIQGYVRCGRGERALTLLRLMKSEGVEPDNVTFVGVLNACSAVGALERGRRLHDQIIQRGYNLNVNLSNSLIDMYARCGSIEDARKIFDSMPTRNVISWNAMIQGYARCGQGWKALDLSQQMLQEGLEPVPVTFVGMANACASVGALDQGRRVHEEIIRKGFQYDIFVGSSLIDMYMKCGSPDDARKVFDNMPNRNVVAWNAMILGYVKCGQGQKALELSYKMGLERVKPDPVTFLGLLKASGTVGALNEGKKVHEKIVQSGCETDIFIGNSLIEMYANCGSLGDAEMVFNKMSARSVCTWNTMIRAGVKCGQVQKALEVFKLMQRNGVEPNVKTFVTVLNACACVGALEEGAGVHKQIIDTGFESDISVSNGLIDMYSKCGNTLAARKVFNKMSSRSVVSWNSMLLGYVYCGHGGKALDLAQRMQEDGMTPDPVSFVAMLNACAITKASEDGKRVHEQMIEAGCELEVYVGSSLINMYAKCGSIENAWRAFNKMPVRSLATWNAMIMGCASCGEERQALDLYKQMQQDGVKPDPVTFAGLLKACGRLRELEEGRYCHEQIIQNGFECDIFVCNDLIDMYGRCGSIEEARKVFDKMPRRNVYSWNNMMLEYARCGQEQSVLRLSEQMQHEKDPESFTGMLDLSAGDGALLEGMSFHEKTMQDGCELDILTGKSMVDMYPKGVSLEAVRGALNRMLTSKAVPQA